MASIGSFGAARSEAAASAEPDTVDFLGQTFRLVDRVGGSVFMDFAELIASTMNEDLAGLRAINGNKELLRACIVPEDWDRLWDTFVREKGSFEELGELATAVFDHCSGRPTPPPAGSAGGPSPTGNPSSFTASTVPVSSPPQPALPQVPLLTGGSPGYPAG